MSTEVGRRAEQAAVKYLTSLGHKVLAQNWRTRWCEIDIITTHKDVVYFVEVKYRRNANFGSGLDYITAQKLSQMQFAAEFWMAQHQLRASGYRLAAIEATGADYEVAAWLDDLP